MLPNVIMRMNQSALCSLVSRQVKLLSSIKYQSSCLLIADSEDGGKRRGAAKRKELDAAEKRIAELTPTLLREFVKEIVVHEATAAHGRMHGNVKRQKTEFYYSPVSKSDLPE